MLLPRRAGFTVAEVVIIVVVIGILASLVTLGYTVFQQQVRDEHRKTDVTVVSEALEKYYAKNGEYPTCMDLGVDPQVVVSTTLPDISPEALRSPGVKNDVTSLVCGTAAPSNGNDAYVYTGDTSTECQTGIACTNWTLSYWEEGTSQYVELKSRQGW